jgi:hypothetical protein
VGRRRGRVCSSWPPAANGFLVRAAAERGLDATGVEPSAALARAAKDAGACVLPGVLPHPTLEGQSFDLGRGRERRQGGFARSRAGGAA